MKINELKQKLMKLSEIWWKNWKTNEKIMKYSGKIRKLMNSKEKRMEVYEQKRIKYSMDI